MTASSFRPIFEYACRKCGHEFEEFQSITAAALRKCPSCRRSALRRRIGAGAGVAAALEVGEKAPEFTLPSTAGGKISLSQFRGKQIVLLEFYGADFAPV